MMALRATLRVVLGIVLATCAAACGADKKAAPATPTVAVVAHAAGRRTVIKSVSLTGTVEPVRTARLTAQVEGEVELLDVREGDAVSAGRTLLRIDPSRLQAALAGAEGELLAVEADLADARGVFERDEKLFQRNGISKERLDASMTKVKRLEAAHLISKARIAGLQAQLADTEIRAPFDGYILERHVELGDVVRAGSPLLSVASAASHVLVQLSEIDLGPARRQNDVTITGGNGLQPCAATIARVRPQIDPATRTATLEVALSRQCGLKLLPGMLVRVGVTLERQTGVLAVPAEAVLSRPDKSLVVFVAESDVASQRRVTTGIEGGGWIEIREGVKEGELVVVQGQERLKDGSAVVLKGKGKGKPPAAQGTR